MQLRCSLETRPRRCDESTERKRLDVTGELPPERSYPTRFHTSVYFYARRPSSTRVRKRRQATSYQQLQIGPHDSCHATDLGKAPDLSNCRLPLANTLA